MKKLLLSLLCFTSISFAETPDPYRWLETEDSKQQEWIATQKKRSEHYFSQLTIRPRIEKRLKEIASFETIALPERRNEAHYYFKKRQEDNKCILVQNINEKETILVNPNTFDEEMNLIGGSLSPNGNYLAYGLALAGSDQHQWKFIDLSVPSKEMETLKEIQFSKVNWDEESSSVFYARNCHQIYLHEIGKDPKQDQLLYEGAEGEMIFGPEPVLDHYLIFAEKPVGTKMSRIKLIHLQDHSTLELIPAGETSFSFVGELNDQLLFITDENCNFGKLIVCDLDGKKRTLIDEQKSCLDQALIIEDHIVCVYSQNAIASLKIFDAKGRFLEELPLPGQGNVAIKGSKYSPYLDYSYSDFKTPSQHFSYNLKTKEHRSTFQPKLNFDPSEFVTKQVWYTSKDGTCVPMFISHRKGLKLDETTPVLLYGYGGFSSSMPPHFRSDFLAWIESDGVLAVPNLRGGKEFGHQWYEQGRQHCKQNVFDDCISAAKYLISEKIGSSKTLAVFGTSNGGLLAGACLTQRPDLFRAAIVNKGVLDMLRFHQFTVGKYWIRDYGDPENPEDAKYLLSYSPYHNLKKGTHYPATLVNTADHDDRVVPLHSYKFAAALQEANASDQPILLRLEKAAGHGGRDSREQEISFGADMLSFLSSVICKSHP